MKNCFVAGLFGLSYFTRALTVYVLPACSLPERSCIGPEPVVLRADARSAFDPAKASLVRASVAPSAALPLFANQPVVPFSKPPFVISSSSAAEAGLAMANPATSSNPAVAIAAIRCRIRLSSLISKRYPPCSAISCSPRPDVLAGPGLGSFALRAGRAAAMAVLPERRDHATPSRPSRPGASGARRLWFGGPGHRTPGHRLTQPQECAAYGASTDTVTGFPPTVAETSVDTDPAGTDTARVVNACAVVLPGASAATDFDPNDDDTDSATGT